MKGSSGSEIGVFRLQLPRMGTVFAFQEGAAVPASYRDVVDKRNTRSSRSVSYISIAALLATHQLCMVIADTIPTKMAVNCML